jgi:predicted dehydrogenase
LVAIGQEIHDDNLQYRLLEIHPERSILMTTKPKTGVSRRDVLKTTGAAVAMSALANVNIPLVHAGGDELIRLALVGCGGRGGGAAENALRTSGPTRLVAMADVVTNRLTGTHNSLQREFRGQVDVPEARRYIGFDGYRRAMDALQPGDVVILATPPAFRWVQFTYAIEKRLNVFMEKPVSVDGPSSRKMFALGLEAARHNLKVAVGLMCRHCDARKALFTRLRDGQLGDINLLRAYRMAGETASAWSRRWEPMVNGRPNPETELQYQIRRFHSFLWLSGGAYSDFLIHNIDECCWMKDAWPISAKASGGRHYRNDYVDQNFDSYSVEYTFADGCKFYLEGRTMNGCHSEFASYAHGSRGAAVISQSGHAPSHARIMRTQNISNRPEDIAWRWGRPQEEPNPYQLEWNNLMTDIRANRAHNEVARGTEASLITAMGRMAAHTGRIITRDQMLACEHEFAPNVDRLTLDGPAPLVAGADGKYPVPRPGIETTREY